MLEKPRAGVHYPGGVADLRAWFGTDAACRDYLDWLRWPDGFACPHCGSGIAWRLADGRYSCGGCKRRVSVTADTISHGTRTPLMVWFEAAWLMMTSKSGTSALNLHRVLALGSYQTSWAMLHRYRDVMVVPARQKLSGTVEIDETFTGGVKPGKHGRGAAGKVLVVGAIERAPKGRRGFGRARMAIAQNAKSDALREFITTNIALCSRIRLFTHALTTLFTTCLMTLFTPETADALNCSLLKSSRIERGHVNDSKFLTKYRTWLKQQTPAQIAA